jgi:hypothetical protein
LAYFVEISLVSEWDSLIMVHSAYFNNFFNFCNAKFSCLAHWWIEIHGGFAKNQVSSFGGFQLEFVSISQVIKSHDLL